MTEVEEIKTVSFKEVHAQLKKEGDFLLQEHNVSDFLEKGNFLKNCGFSNSIASRLYIDTATKSEFIKKMYDKYHGLYRFLLEPQLERLCEKYNLYVRKLDHFIGDIPSKNVQDLMNFKLYSEDLMDIDSLKLAAVYKYVENNIAITNTGHSGISGIDRLRSSLNNLRSHAEEVSRFYQNMSGEMRDNVWHNQILGADKINLAKINELSNLAMKPIIEIAAVKSMFDDVAFSDSGTMHNRALACHPTKRILQYTQPAVPEAPARSRVDLDPIVLVNLDGCRLIVTAWGDESNDELVANPTNN